MRLRARGRAREKDRVRQREGGKRVVELTEGGGRVKPPAADR